MDELVRGWQSLLTSAQLPTALDQGRAAVVRMLGDTVDGYLQATFPPYATAVAICADESRAVAALGRGVDCNEARLEIRDAVLTEALIVSGVMKLIDQAIRMWHAMPPEVRAMAREALQTYQTFGELMNDPTVGNFYNFAYSASTQTLEMAYAAFEVLLDGEVFTRLGTWIEAATDPKRIAQYLSNASLGGWAADGVTEGVRALFGDSVADTLEPITDAALDAYSTGSKIVTSAAQGIEDLASYGYGTVTNWF